MLSRGEINTFAPEMGSERMTWDPREGGQAGSDFVCRPPSVVIREEEPTL